jgi:hypothetical protein
MFQSEINKRWKNFLALKMEVTCDFCGKYCGKQLGKKRKIFPSYKKAFVALDKFTLN